MFDAPFLLLGFIPFFFLGSGYEDTSAFETGTDVTFEPDFGRDISFHVPDLATVGILSLAFGVAYLLISR